MSRGTKGLERPGRRDALGASSEPGAGSSGQLLVDAAHRDLTSLSTLEFGVQREPGDPAQMAASRSQVGRVRSIQRSWARLRTGLLFAGDLCAALLAGSLAQSMRLGSEPLQRWVTTASGPANVSYAHVSIGFILAWSGALAASGAYSRRSRASMWDQSTAIAKAAVGSLAAVSVLSLSLQLQLSRAYVGVALVAAVLSSLLGRLFAFGLFSSLQHIGIGVERLVIVGDDSPATRSLTQQFKTTAAKRTRLVGEVKLDGADAAEVAARVSVVAARSGATTVVVCGGPSMPLGLTRTIAATLGGTGISVVVAPGAAEAIGPGVQLHSVGDLFLLRVRDSKPSIGDRLIKSLLDRAIASVALLLFGPVMCVLTILIRRESGGPALFRQQRIGRNGEPFKIYKFRTMVRDAEAVLRHDGLWDSYVANGYKLPAGEDPRITRIGAKLRSSSLDELPQLLNVLNGTMSLVGPRPVVPEELDCYGVLIGAYTGVRPGLTGYWQVNGRSDVGFPERAELDAYYHDHRSLRVDLRILLRTVVAVLRRVGAH